MATIASRLVTRFTSNRLPRVVAAVQPESRIDTLHRMFMLVLVAIAVLVAFMGVVRYLPAWFGGPPLLG